MSTKKTNLIVLTFIIFIAIVFVGTTVVIYNTPVEIVSLTNYTGNIMNGGYIYEDSGFLFYCNPKSGEVIRTETENISEKVKILDNANGYLQENNSRYYFLEGNTFKSCKIDGTNVKTLIEFAQNPIVAGAAVYYKNESGYICKYSIKNNTVTKLPVKPAGQFLIYSNIIYYISDNGNIRNVSFNGEDDKLFLDVNATKFSLDGNGKYVFYLSNGAVYSAEMTESSFVFNKIVNATDFVVQKQFIIYNNKSLYWANINDIVSEKDYVPKKLLDGKGIALSVDSTYFYFFRPDGTLCRIKSTGDGLTVFK